ncbi:MAG: glycosyltransferase family 4 protein [Candidatus Jordarchaeaceae archaeon]
MSNELSSRSGGIRKICLASHSFYPYVGGVSYYLYYLSQEFLRRKFEVYEVHLGKPSAPSVEEVEGVKVYRVGLGDKKESWNRYSLFKERLYEQIHGLRVEGEWSREGYKEFVKFNKVMASKINQICSSKKIDVVNPHDWQLHLTPDYLDFSVPVVYTWHVPFTSNMGEKLGRQATAKLKKCDKVIFSTQDYLNYAKLLGVPEEKLVCIHPFIEPSRFYLDEKEGYKFKKEKGIPLDSEIVLCVARIDPVKSHEELLKAFSIIKKQYRNAKLVLVGNGSLSDNVLEIRGQRRASIQKLVEKLGLGRDTIFMGHVPHKDIPKVYKMADVVVLPSKMEGFGLSITEAMASERPVVAYNVGGVGVQIENGRSGFLVEKGNINELAAKTCELLSDKELKRKMGERARQIVEEKFNVRKAVDKYLNVYQEAIDGR